MHVEERERLFAALAKWVETDAECAIVRGDDLRTLLDALDTAERERRESDAELARVTAALWQVTAERDAVRRTLRAIEQDCAYALDNPAGMVPATFRRILSFARHALAATASKEGE